MTKKKSNVVDLNKYRDNQRLREQIKKLDELADHVYINYSRTEQEGYENFKKLLKALDKKYDPSNQD